MTMNRWCLSILLLLQVSVTTTAFAPTPPHQQQRNRNPIIHDTVVTNSLTALYSKKKGGSSSGGGGAATSPSSKGKVQVKLLKHVAGTGQAGQVVLVTPAFFNNKLRPTKSAQLITDEQVAQELSEQKQQEQHFNDIATALQSKIAGLTLILARKAGPDGQLFGGINPKMIAAELQAKVGDPEDYLNQKGVKITELLDESRTKLTGDIKHTGKFSCSISLRTGISATFDIVVKPEE